MMEFRFHSPELLLLLTLIPPLVYWRRSLKARGNAVLLKFAEATSLKNLINAGSAGGAGKVSELWYWIGITCLIFALARPQGNPVVVEGDSTSLDVIVLLDVSRSMDTEDVPPSRIKKAKKSIQTLLDRLSGDRVGVIAFAGSAVLVSPLTTDYEIVKVFLKNVDTSLIQNQGTDFSSALMLAAEAMEKGAESLGQDAPSRTNVFILMSDGEDHNQNYSEEIARVNSLGGIVFSIALGTEKGAPIPLRNDRGELTGYKRDEQGQPVVSAVKTEALKDIASKGGGRFYYSTQSEGEIDDIVAQTKDMQRTGAKSIRAKVYEEYFLYPLALGFILLMLFYRPAEWILRSRRTGLWLIVFLPLNAHALNPFLSKESRLSEEASNLARDGKTAEAEEILKNLTADNPESAALNYNLGTVQAEGKKFAESKSTLSRLSKHGGVESLLAKFNLAGVAALEKKKDEARAGYASLIGELKAKTEPTPEETTLLERARKSLQRLEDESQQAQPQDNKEQQDQKQQNEEKKEQEKKQDNQSGQKDGKPEPKQDEKPQPRAETTKDKRQFQERDNMSEADAKRVLEALKEQESGLQKKFLKAKDKGGKFKEANDNGKDW